MGLLDFIFPRFCVSCSSEGSLWCEPCQSVAAFQQASILHPTPHIDLVYAIHSYGAPMVRELVKVWKYHGDAQAQDVVNLWVKRGMQMHPPSDCVVTHVPLHITRRRARGFDQAEELARMVSTQWDVPHMILLERVVKTNPQAKTEHEKRVVGEFEGVFAALGDVPEHVVLVDDVFTSGTTMDAAAQALKAAGAKKVVGVVLAKGS